MPDEDIPNAEEVLNQYIQATANNSVTLAHLKSVEELLRKQITALSQQGIAGKALAKNMQVCLDDIEAQIAKLGNVTDAPVMPPTLVPKTTKNPAFDFSGKGGTPASAPPTDPSNNPLNDRINDFIKDHPETAAAIGLAIQAIRLSTGGPRK